jgi:hypothetical protein
LFYNSRLTPELQKEFTKQQNLLTEKGCLDALSCFDGTPSLRVSFIGDCNGLPLLLHGGLKFVHLEAAEQNISMFSEKDLR